MTKLTSRERVLMALKHQEPDRVPIDFGATRSTGINAVAYNDLKKYLGLNPESTLLYDVKQLLALPEQELLDWSGTDVIGLPRLAPSMGLKVDRWKPGTLPDGSPCLLPEDFNPVTLDDGCEAVIHNGQVVAKRPGGGLYFDEVYAPLGDAIDEADLDRAGYPAVSDAELKYLADRARDLYENTEYAIVGHTGISIFEKGIKDFGYEEWLVKIMTEQDLVRSYLERLTEAYLSMMDRYLDAVGRYVQVIQANDDLGMQQGPLIPPQLYRELFKPFHQEIFRFIKKKQPGVFIFLHSCGSIYDFIPDLIEAGVDILNPVQINAAKMHPRTLKGEFGSEITFWGGGCSTQTTLTFGSVDDVRREVEEMMEVFKPNGGFIFNQVHNIQAGVAPEKITALFETAKGVRNYAP
ncbi:MAG: methyltransferase [Clostridia bacterium]|nr:methyltransferase [Clostridia bacterium]